MSIDREQLGRIVREEWVQYCREIGDTKPSHLASWEELDESDREVDRRIGERVARAATEQSAEQVQALRDVLLKSGEQIVRLKFAGSKLAIAATSGWLYIDNDHLEEAGQLLLAVNHWDAVTDPEVARLYPELLVAYVGQQAEKGDA